MAHSEGPDSGREIVQRGLYFEEFEEGARYAHRPGRTVTEADNVLFSALTMNTQALHLDAAYSATQPFGQRLMNSMWTLATMVGASVTQLTQSTLVAQLGLSDIAFPHPLFAGDTLYTETTIESKRLSSSRPGQGLVTMRHTGRNQDGTVVATATRVALMWCADAHADRPAPPVDRPVPEPVDRPVPEPVDRPVPDADGPVPEPVEGLVPDADGPVPEPVEGSS
ncbi:MaoC/PaaZ C-terminal domain-containing protein [Micromonospora sp. DT81.3]|uniref:MaoC family dehydratase n=1 Tax=Micromonospora sp. DT81.3 TaxID=3416523 RepID=UPI003CF46B5C